MKIRKGHLILMPSEIDPNFQIQKYDSSVSSISEEESQKNLSPFKKLSALKYHV